MKRHTELIDPDLMALSLFHRRWEPASGTTVTHRTIECVPTSAVDFLKLFKYNSLVALQETYRQFRLAEKKI